MTKAFPQCLQEVVLQLLEDLGSPRCLTVALMVRYGEFGQLVNLTVTPAHYLNAYDFFVDIQATDLLRKCADLDTGIDRRKAAVESFLSSERECARTNVRFDRHIHNGPFEDLSEVRVHDFLIRVKKTVEEILGSLPRELQPRHGPGATYQDRGRKITAPDKMASQPTCTKSARALLPLWSQTAWARYLLQAHPHRSDPLTVSGNRFVTVPKDATKDRGIAVSPSLNVFYQLGVGNFLRGRLRKVNIDLNNGQDLHRAIAREASRRGHLSTIDLSSASDTVSFNLVKFLLPEHWFDLLEILREPFTEVDGSRHFLQKFSAMGNGYTFELETIVFLALAVESCRSQGVTPEIGVNVLVYGDDILIPSECSAGLLAVLRYCGFTANRRKTFTDGYFRESCGGDFFNGVAVRPHYLKEFPHEPQDWIVLANGLRRVVCQHFDNSAHLGPFQRAWFRVLDNLPVHIRRLRGPVELGDLVVHDDPSRWQSRTRHSIRWIAVYRPVSKPIPLGKWHPLVQLASALYGVPSEGPTLRGSVRGYRIGWAAFS